MASQPARAASTGLNYVMYFAECECNCLSCLSSWQDNSGHFPSDILDIRKKHRWNLGDSGSCDWLREKKKHQSEIHRNSTFSQFGSSGAAVERRSDFPALLPLSPAPGRGGHRSLKLSDLSDLSDRRIAQEWKCPGPLFAAMYISGILAMPSLDMIEIYGLNVFLPTPSHHVVQHL